MVQNTNHGGLGDQAESSSETAPAEGERRAVSGYHHQYRTSACLILRSLMNRQLEWIRVADPTAGRVDDLQIGSPGRIDAYQVKSGQYGGSFTFNGLTTPQGEAPPLIAQLAQGWRTLKRQNPESRAVVHLITNEFASTSSNTSIPTNDPSPTPRHFAAFIDQAWGPAHRTPSNDTVRVPDEWQQAWAKLLETTQLTAAEFEHFVRDCSLEFGFNTQSWLPSGLARDQRYVDEDVTHITNVLFGTVADPQRFIQLTHRQLLQCLNWTERFEYRNRHDFPVDVRTYREIQTSAATLTDAINELLGGYLVVLGGPGSGKSTLLTQRLKGLDARLVPYYAYVPDSTGPRASRGETVNFLHDVVLDLEYAGFTVGGSTNRFDRELLLERLHEQLHMLHLDWKETGTKTIILVDGLDHIDREQHPGRSLLTDLPDPAQIPDGVYFVLGTQTEAPLSGRIKAQVSRPERKIEMQPLNRLQVHEIIQAASLQPNLSQGQMDRAYDLSSGHPLYLSYLINRLRQCDHADEIEHELVGGTPYDGDIESSYYSYWEQFNADEELVNLLGLVARMRGRIDISWVATWADYSVLDRLGKRFAHYFRIEDNHRWYFFHNSFRLFLIAKTAEFPPGHFDPERDRRIHIELADRCSESGAGHQVWVWEELHHRFAAGQHDTVLDLATQEYFRGQFKALRPLEAIREDIQKALMSASVRQDVVALIRLGLIGTELNQRGEYLEEVSLVRQLLKLGERDLAVEYVRNGNHLRVDANTAFEAVEGLAFLRMMAEARRVFDLAEARVLLPRPVDTRFADQEVSPDLLKSWIRASLLFRDTDEIVDSISRLRYEYDRSTGFARNERRRSLQADLLSCLGQELLAQERWGDLRLLSNAFEVTTEEGSIARFWLSVSVYLHRYSSGDLPAAEEYLNLMMEIDSTYLGPKELTALAEGKYLVLGDHQEARQMQQDLPDPEVRTHLFMGAETLQPFEERLFKSRLDYLLGERRSPEEIIPDPDDWERQGLVLLERAICTVGQIWARAWTDEKLNASTVKIVATPLLRLHGANREASYSWSLGLTFRMSESLLYELVIDAVAEHGPAALAGLQDLFQMEWSDAISRSHWPTSDKRSVIKRFIKAGCSTQWATQALQELDDLVPVETDVSGRVGDCVEHAEAWVEVGDLSRARRFLELAIETSFGVGYRKDYQMDRWISLLGKINEIEPEKAAERTAKFAHGVRDLEESTEGRVLTSAASLLLSATFRWSPVRATWLFFWFADQRIMHYWSGMASLVGEASKSPGPAQDTALMVIKEFLLPFDTSGDASLMTRIVERLDAATGQHRMIDEVRSLVERVELDARPSVRPTWLRGLKEGANNIGLPEEGVEFDIEEPSETDDLRYNPKYLRLKGKADPLGYKEVQDRASSVEAVAELRQREDDGSFFDWVPLVTAMVQDATEEATLIGLTALFRDDRESVQILNAVSLRMEQLGHHTAAWDIGEKALKTASEYDWHPRIAGGSKIAAARTLRNLDHERAVPLIWETLLDDLHDAKSLIGTIPEIMEDLLELLDPAVAFEDVWSEIEAHTSELIGATYPPAPWDPFEEEITGDNPHRSMVDLIVAHLGHPCVPVVQAAQRCLGQLLLERANYVVDVLIEALEKSGERLEPALMIIDAVSSFNPEAVEGFRDVVCRLDRSPSWMVKRITRAIIANCGWSQHAAVPIARPLPPAYYADSPIVHRELALPNNVDLRAGTPDRPPALSGPLVPFELDLRIIANVASVPLDRLHARVVELMHQLAPRESTWSPEAERRLGSDLRSVGIQVAFAKPQVKIARSAMFLAAAELADGGRISRRGNDILSSVLRTYDPRMVLERPSHKPSQIPAIMLLDEAGDEETWVREAAKALSCTDWIPDSNRLVLAEATNLEKRRDRASYAETRYSVLSDGRAAWRDLESSPHLMFGQVTRKLVSEYQELGANPETSDLVILHAALWIDTPGTNWLALNPAIGVRFGWSIADSGMFRWLDDQGRMMAESIWWTDGRLDVSGEGLRDNEVGEGWLVMVSESALEQIQIACGPLSRKSAVVRRFEKGSNSVDWTAVSGTQ